MKPVYKERNEEIKRMVEDGHTHREIAYAFEISRSRVGQILDKMRRKERGK